MSNNTYNKIIETATDLFAMYSFYGVSMTKIALEANVNKAAVYYYFRNKENLYIEVLRTIIQKINKNPGNLSEANKSSEIEFAKNMDGISKFLVKNQSLLRLLIYELNSGGKYLNKILSKSTNDKLKTFLEDELPASPWNQYSDKEKQSYSGLNEQDFKNWIRIYTLLDSILNILFQNKGMQTTPNEELDFFSKGEH